MSPNLCRRRWIAGTYELVPTSVHSDTFIFSPFHGYKASSTVVIPNIGPIALLWVCVVPILDMLEQGAVLWRHGKQEVCLKSQVICKHSRRPAHDVFNQHPFIMQEAACGLMAFGAVYYSRVHPHPSQCKTQLSAADTARLARIHQNGVQKHGPDVRHDPTVLSWFAVVSHFFLVLWQSAEPGQHGTQAYMHRRRAQH